MSNNTNFKTNPHEVDISNDNIESLLLVDGEVYQPDKFENFKVNLMIKDIKFDYINPHMENDVPCGSVTYNVVIYDTNTGLSETFDLFENFLIKNITEDMVQKQLNLLIEQAAVAHINIAKYVDLYFIELEHAFNSILLQTATLLCQIVSLANFIVTTGTLP
jgi:hypothetical protein